MDITLVFFPFYGPDACVDWCVLFPAHIISFISANEKECWERVILLFWLTNTELDECVPLFDVSSEMWEW